MSRVIVAGVGSSFIPVTFLTLSDETVAQFRGSGELIRTHADPRCFTGHAESILPPQEPSYANFLSMMDLSAPLAIPGLDYSIV